MLPAMTEEVSSSMDQMGSTSEKLSGQAERLKEAIELFKIERRIRGARTSRERWRWRRRTIRTVLTVLTASEELE